MIVNDNRLNYLIQKIIRDCCDCPLYKEDEMCEYLTDKGVSCESLLLKWLQEFDAAEALEAGAHIVNDQIIFPPEEIPYEPCYGTPCEVRNERGKASMDCDECEYNFSCPYC